MSDDVECPYCGAEQEINHDDGYGYDDGDTHNQECPECGKTFTYTTSISFSYEVMKADCLNGGEHIWKPIRGCPSAYFDGQQRCSQCAEERDTMKPEDRKAKMETYFKWLKDKK
jgi:transposase-like protein